MNSPQEFEFGYFPDEIKITQGPITISTLPGLDNTKEDIRKDPDIRNDWIYPGNAETRLLGGGVRTEPYSVRVFGLPKTHLIKHVSAVDEEHVKFFVWALSFFVGMRLTTEEAGFLDATTIKSGKLTDFVITGSDLAPAIKLADRFWIGHQTDRQQAKRLCAAIHALFVTQNPQNLEFESFLYHYTALDACFAILRDEHNLQQNLPHARRIECMCQILGISVPQWALNVSSSSAWASQVSVLRNDTIHEALYSDEPLGFKVQGGGTQNLNLEMWALTCRILAAIFGVQDNRYLGSAVNTRQMHGMRLT